MPVLALALVAALAPGWHGDRAAPRAAFEPARLAPLPASALAVCRRVQRAAPRLVVLCPRLLPRATIAVLAGEHRPPRVRAETMGVPARPRAVGLVGVDFSYGAPVEPASGRGWREHLWMNRPCCFLHFGVWTLFSRLPPGTRRASLSGISGRLLPATSHGHTGRGYWWTNHTWFFWRRGASWRAAHLHVFGGGTETRRLLARLIRGLRPTRALR